MLETIMADQAPALIIRQPARSPTRRQYNKALYELPGVVSALGRSYPLKHLIAGRVLLPLACCSIENLITTPPKWHETSANLRTYRRNQLLRLGVGFQSLSYCWISHWQGTAFGLKRRLTPCFYELTNLTLNRSFFVRLEIRHYGV